MMSERAARDSSAPPPSGELMKKSTLRGVLWIAAVCAVLGAGGWYVFRPRAEVPRYQTGQAVRGSIERSVTASGQLNAVVKVQVGSQIAGNIQKLFADYNSVVKKGQVIAQLDPATSEASVRQNEGDLAGARASLELARAEARRYDELYASHLISQSDHDTKVASLHQAEATVQTRQAVLDRARADLAYCTIYAPIDGVVISRKVDVGQTVAAGLAVATLFEIANDLTKMQVDAKVSEADIGEVRGGQEARFTVDAYPSRTFTGTVKQVRNEAVTSQNVVTYDTVIETNNPDLALKPGMTAVVNILLDRRESTLKIPASALSFRPTAYSGGALPASATAASPVPPPPLAPEGPGEPATVYVLMPGRGGASDSVIAPRPIRTGLSDGTSVEVLAGLQEGDLVATGYLAASASKKVDRETVNPLAGRGPGGPGGPPPPPPR
jgi:HlyD family secretion protein